MVGFTKTAPTAEARQAASRTLLPVPLKAPPPWDSPTLGEEWQQELPAEQSDCCCRCHRRRLIAKRHSPVHRRERQWIRLRWTIKKSDFQRFQPNIECLVGRYKYW